MNGPDPAERLMRGALSLIPQGDWAGAAATLEQAASLHAQAKRTYDEARCLQLAATLRRASGDAASSRMLTERAAAVATVDLPLAVSILAERAEALAAQGEHRQAAETWTECLEKARQARLAPPGLIGLLRRRAAVYIGVGELSRAAADFAESCGLADERVAGFLRAEQARLLLDHGYAAEAASALLAADVADPHLRAEILTLQARMARESGDAATARDRALTARAAALEAVAPVAYFAASVELAEALDAAGLRVDAYTALATAWGTLSDLLGRDLANSWVEPCLLAFRLRWSDAAFAEAKAAHDARRRTEQEKDPR
jgi:hypothetical protein